MWNQLQESVSALVGVYGTVTLSFIEEQEEWLGVPREETDECVKSLIEKGEFFSPSPGRIQARR